MNGNKFATGQIMRKPVEVAKGRILASWAQKFAKPCLVSNLSKHVRSFLWALRIESWMP